MANADSSLPRVYLTLALCLVASCGGGEEPKVDPVAEVKAQGREEAPNASAPSGLAEDQELSGAELGAQVFSNACAVCHGESGDGNGSAKFDKPARSFVDGGFSFGNTPEALFRTVSSGIGGTPMPGFKDSLTEGKRRAVVDHVIALGPEQVVVEPGSTVMTVTDKPVVVRGSFPPLREGDEMTPRGLLVGGLDGLSFQYDRDDMRLIAVRQGDFVKRRDWENRGGDTLEPLGELVFVPDDALGEVTWRALDWDAEPKVGESGIQGTRAKMTATEIQADYAIVEFDLYLGSKRIASVQEHTEALSLGGWTGFRRTFEAELVNASSVTIGLEGGDDFESLHDLGGPGQTVRLATDELGLGTIWITHGMVTEAVADITAAPVPVKWTHDFLYGLKPTEANLAALKEAL